jgi:hypothetical protein
MRLRSLFTVLAVASSLGLAVSCSDDSPTTPPAATPKQGDGANATLLSSPITIIPLQRTAPLATNEVVQKRIGLLGGTLVLPNAGLTIVVPALAVTSPVTITATALAGSNVAYEFEPHGLQFLAPVVMTQDLSVTEARTGGTIDPLLLYLGYFPNSSNITSVTELLSVQVNLPLQTSVGVIWHFSGYVLATGRSDESPPGDGQ